VIREGAYALGASKWQTVSDHILPYSMPGILTGVIIGLARAIGETAPVITIGALTFIAFLPPMPLSPEPPFVNFEWLMSPFTVMPIQMFNWTSRPEEVSPNAAGPVVCVMPLAEHSPSGALGCAGISSGDRRAHDEYSAFAEHGPESSGEIMSYFYVVPCVEEGNFTCTGTVTR